MSGFIERKRTIGFKIESTPYTAETLAVADYNVSAMNLKYGGIIPMKERKIARGDYSHDPAVAGKRSFKCSFEVDFMYSTNPITPPNYFKCLQACGMKQTIGTLGVWLVTNSDYSNVPATIEYVERDEGLLPNQLVYKGRGCMGNAKVVLDAVGTPLRIQFDFEGVLSSVTDRPYASIIVPSGFMSNIPDAFLGVTSSLFGELPKYGKTTIDLGNVLAEWSNPGQSDFSGIEGVRIVDRNPSVTIDPDMQLLATSPMYTRVTQNTQGAFSLQSNHFLITMPQVQVHEGTKPGSREGHVTNEMKLVPNRQYGNDEIVICQGQQV